MSRRNYNNYSKNNVQEEQIVAVESEAAQEVTQEVKNAVEIEETTVTTPVAETTETADPAILGAGVVCNCAKLNIREKPEVSSRVACIVNADSELVVYDGSYGNFYKVCTASGIEGYCMKDYVSLK